MRPTTSRSGLRLAAWTAALAGCVFAAAQCGEQGKYSTTPTGGSSGNGPGVTVQIPAKTDTMLVTVGDSVFVQVHLSDSRGVTSLVISGTSVRGSVNLGTDTTVQRFIERTVTLPKTKDTVITRYLRAVLTDSTSEFVTVGAVAINTANDTTRDTSVVRVVDGPHVAVLQPAPGAVTAIGKSVTVQVRGMHTLGIKVLGWRATGVVTAQDSTVYTPAGGILPDTQTFTSSLAIPTSTKTGAVVIVPFAVDSIGNPSGVVPGDTVSVQSVVGDTTAPLVQDTMPLRAEVGDSITVTATDPSGITKVGFLVRDTAGTIVHGDSVTFGGTSTNVTYKFRLNLDTISTFPRVVSVEAFGVDGATPSNRGGSSVSGTPKKWPAADTDTLTIVAGQTIALPQGGQLGDAVIDPNNVGGNGPVLLLTNTTLNQVDVFRLNSGTFTTPIQVGSQPVGISLWPHDTLGDNADTVVVANSGGTNFSIVDLVSRAEVQRHRLANYVVQTVTTQPTAAGGIEILTTDYDLSDRPQYVGTVCRHLAGAVCDSVYAIYSTAPTPAQPQPFTSRGYLASENLSAPISARSGHLYYELADPGTDTLQIIAVRDTLPGQAIRDTLLGAGVGKLVTLSTVAFQESTFVRNSGDFNHAVIGEGGFDQGYARALAVDGRAPIVRITQPPCPLRNPTTDSILGYLNCNAIVDQGVSPGVLVRDFLVNRAAPVLSVATNFNGRTSLVRADSIYAFDYTLRQTGLLPVPSGQPGMDFDPRNAFDADTRTSAGLNKNDRLVFAARPDAFIDVFDTYWYSRIATVPIRDTIIGPIRVANTGTGLVLVGVTSRGLVVVRLPSFVNPLPAREQPGQALPPVRTLPAFVDEP